MSTNERLTKERLDAIRERADNATTGPWVRWEGWDDADNSVSSDGREDAPTIADLITEKADAEFISRAREDIPALLAEVERLRDELAKAREVTEEKVERAKWAFGAATAVTSSIPLWMSEDAFIHGVAIQHGYAIRIALQIAMGGGGDA